MRLLALLMVGLLVAACSTEPTAPPPSDETAGSEMLEGTLGGDAQLEGGCAWLETEDGRFEVMYPDGYEVAFDPLRLLGPGGETLAEEGQTIRVEGAQAPDMVSVCQVGPLFEATEVLTGD